MSDSSLPADNSATTVGEWLRSATEQLTQSDVNTARLDALVLLSDALGKDRSVLLAHLDQPIGPNHISNLHAAVQRRSMHVPLAYIRGKAEFYGREFSITPDVLVPRPESESLIELLLTHPGLVGLRNSKLLAIADIGTGCGALAITAKLSLPGAAVYATDIDTACLDLAARNAQQLGAQLRVAQGDFVEPLRGAIEQEGDWILLCNLPYVPVEFPINRAASHEPALALFAGQDGLDAFRRLFDQLSTLYNAPYAIITESLPGQHNQLADIARGYGYTIAATSGLAQLLTRATG